MDNTELKLHFKRKRDIALYLFFVTTVVFAALDLFFGYSKSWIGVSWILNVFTTVFLVFSWCSYDSQSRGELLSGRFKFWIIMLAAVAVPLYLKSTRGWKGAAKIGFGIPVFGASILLYYASWYCFSWIAVATGYYQ